MAKSKYEGLRKIFKVLTDDPEIRVGFSDMNLWADTGVYALNQKLSGDYYKAFLYGTMVGIYGESQSGKTLILAQTAANEQRERGAFVIWVDTEGANSDRTEAYKWLTQAGLDLSEEKFLRLSVPTFRKSLKMLTQWTNWYREVENPKELQPIFIVFDSYSLLQTDTMIEQNRGKKDLTGDQGQKAKQLGDFVTRARSMIEGLPILITGVMHIYMSQEEYGPRHKITGGVKPLYMAHSCISMTKKTLTNENASAHLKQSANTGDQKKNIGLLSAVEIVKSRSSKPGEKLDLEVLYPYGIDKYSGLWDLFIEKDIIWSPSNGWYEFKRADGTTKKFQRKSFLTYIDELMKLPLPEYMRRPDAAVELDDDEIGPSEVPEEGTE